MPSRSAPSTSGGGRERFGTTLLPGENVDVAIHMACATRIAGYAAAIGSPCRRRRMRMHIIALGRAVAGGMAVHAARRGEYLCGFAEQRAGTGGRIANRGKCRRRFYLDRICRLRHATGPRGENDQQRNQPRQIAVVPQVKVEESHPDQRDTRPFVASAPTKAPSLATLLTMRCDTPRRAEDRRSVRCRSVLRSVLEINSRSRGGWISRVSQGSEQGCPGHCPIPVMPRKLGCEIGPLMMGACAGDASGR
jgi:hypothetical protein